MNVINLVGVLGATVLLVAFVLNELHKLSEESLIYDAMNFIGAALLVVYAYLIESIPFLVLNAVWGLVALRDIVLDLRINKKHNGQTQ